MNISIGVEKTLAQPWQQIYPNFRSNDVAMLVHWNEDTLFAVGANGLFVRSTDAGSHWENVFQKFTDHNLIRAGASKDKIYMLPAITFSTLNDFSDSSRIILFSYNPRTHDTTRITVPTVLSSRTTFFYFNDLSVTNNCIALLQMAGKSSAVVFSCDDGNTWTAQPLPDTIKSSGNKLITIDFFDRNRGVVLVPMNGTQSYEPLITSDGGISWNASSGVSYSQTPYFGAVSKLPTQWIDDSTLLLVGGGYIPMITTDFGRSWDTLAPLPFTVAYIHLSKQGTGYAISTSAEISKTTDMGKSWKLIRNKLNVYGHQPIHGLALGVDTLIQCGPVGNIFFTHDAGLTWEHALANPFFYTYGLHFFTIHEGSLIAKDLFDEDQYYYRSKDGGKSWEKRSNLSRIAVNSSKEIKDVTSSVNYMIVRSSDTLILISEDEGKTWTASYIRAGGSSIEPLRHVEGKWYRNAELFLVPTNKGFLRTHNRGRLWELIPDTTFENILSIDATNINSIWLLTRKNLFQSNDDGSSWKTVLSLPDTIREFVRLHVLSKDMLYIRATTKRPMQSGFESLLLKTTDGGMQWMSNELPDYISDELMTAPGKGIGGIGIGYYYSMCSNLVSTQDDWKSFQYTQELDFYSTAGGFISHFFLTEGIGWVSSFSAIYHTTNGGINWIEQPIKAPSFSLSQNYPNPTSSLTTIPFEITSDVASRNFYHGIKLVVYDLLGREVATIARDQLEVGKNQISFDASRLQAGVYCYRLMVGEQAVTRKMVVVK